MSRRKMIGAHVARPKSTRRTDCREVSREFNRAYEQWTKKPGRTHLAFTPATMAHRIS